LLPYGAGFSDPGNYSVFVDGFARDIGFALDIPASTVIVTSVTDAGGSSVNVFFQILATSASFNLLLYYLAVLQVQTQETFAALKTGQVTGSTNPAFSPRALNYAPPTSSSSPPYYVIGIVLGVLALVAILYVLYRRKNRNRYAARQTQGSMQQQYPGQGFYPAQSGAYDQSAEGQRSSIPMQTYASQQQQGGAYRIGA